MRRWTLALALLLLASVLVHELTCEGVQRPGVPTPAAIVPSRGQAPDASARSRNETSPPGASTPAAPAVAPPSDPTRAILAEQERYAAYLKALDAMVAARSRIGDEQYHAAILSLTADFLELAGAARLRFVETAISVCGDVKLADRDFRAAQQQIVLDPGNPLPAREHYSLLHAQYQRHLDAARVRMLEIMDSDHPWQSHFRDPSVMDGWIYYLTGSNQPPLIDGPGPGMAESD